MNNCGPDTLFESDDKLFCFDTNFSANVESSYECTFGTSSNHLDNSPSSSSSTATKLLFNTTYAPAPNAPRQMQDSSIESLQKQFNWLKLQAINSNLDSSSFPKIICRLCHDYYNEKFMLTTGFETYLSHCLLVCYSKLF